MWVLLGSQREVTLACAGFIVGGLVGVAVGLAIKKNEPDVRYMEAIQISHYMGPEVTFSTLFLQGILKRFSLGGHSGGRCDSSVRVRRP